MYGRAGARVQSAGAAPRLGLGAPSDPARLGWMVTQESTESLTVRDNRTGQEYDVPITDGTIKAADIGTDQGRRRRARPRRLRPRLRQHRLVPQRRHLHRRREGDPRVPRLPHRAARREVQLPRGRLPARARHAADQGGVRRLGARDHLPHVRPRERQGVHAGLPLRRPPDGDADGVGRRPVDVLPRRPQHQRRRQPAHADRADDREDADPRRLVVPARAGQAVRLPRQRAELHRQLPLDAVQDERAEVRAPTSGWSRRSTCCSSCTPTTSRTARPTRSARSARRRSTPTPRSPPASPPSSARCTAAPTRRCCGCCAGSASKENIPDFIKGVKDGNEKLMGFGHRVYKNYDPRATIIKKAARTSSRSPASTRCSTSPRSSRRSRSRTSTSSSASSTPTSTSTPA